VSLKEQLNNDSVGVFLNSTEFAEVILYTSKGGAAKEIPAIVDRSRRLNPAEEDSSRVALNEAEIFIANDAANGVLSVNKGGDAVSLPQRVGDANVNWIVVDILNQDEGFWQLLIRK
jgi:hypothetical protein